MKQTLRILIALFSLAAASFAGDAFGSFKMPSVQVAPVSPVVVTRSKPGKVQLAFRVQPGFHINSNRPNDESLMPTVLRLTAPNSLAISRIAYPAGRDMGFAFAPGEKINVYAGDFTVTALVTTSRPIPPGSYRVRGALKYQGCDNRQCYPPKEVPVEFDVKVQETAGPQRSSLHMQR